MNKTIYKTQPRLFITSMTLLGFVFFGLLLLLTNSYVKDNNGVIVISIMVIFSGFSITSLFYFFSIKTLKLTTNNFEISCFLIPLRTKYSLDEIMSISQSKKEISAVYGVSWTARYIYTEITTIIKLTDKSIIKLNSVSQLDFEKFNKVYTKLKRGEGKIKTQKRNLLIYILDNIDGLIWVILLIIMTAGLIYGLLTKN